MQKRSGNTRNVCGFSLLLILPPPTSSSGVSIMFAAQDGVELGLGIGIEIGVCPKYHGQRSCTAHCTLHTTHDRMMKTSRRPQRRPPNNHGNQNSGSTKVQTSTPLIIKSGDDARQSLLNVVVAPLLPCINASSSHSPATPVPPPSMTWVSEPIIKY